MLRLEFTEAQTRVLNSERFRHKHPRVRRKMEVLWLKSQGLAHQDIVRLAGVTGKTMRRYFQEYVDGGFEGLKELHFRRLCKRFSVKASRRFHWDRWIKLAG